MKTTLSISFCTESLHQVACKESQKHKTVLKLLKLNSHISFRMFLSCILITLKCLYRLKCPLAGANKRFLINTIKNTLPSQKEQDQEREQREVSKEPEPNKSRKEEKPKKRRIHPYTPSFQSRRRVSYSPPRHRNRNQHTKDKYEKRSSKR